MWTITKNGLGATDGANKALVTYLELAKKYDVFLWERISVTETRSTPLAWYLDRDEVCDFIKAKVAEFNGETHER